MYNILKSWRDLDEDPYKNKWNVTFNATFAFISTVCIYASRVYINLI